MVVLDPTFKEAKSTDRICKGMHYHGKWTKYLPKKTVNNLLIKITRLLNIKRHGNGLLVLWLATVTEHVKYLKIENSPRPGLIQILLTGNLFGASKHRQDNNAQQMALLRDKDQSKDTTQQVSNSASVLCSKFHHFSSHLLDVLQFPNFLIALSKLWLF